MRRVFGAPTWREDRVIWLSPKNQFIAVERASCGMGGVYLFDYAMASRNPGARSSLSAYSRWRTRLGSSARAFDDEWTSNGLIANTPPRGTYASTFSLVLASSRV